MFTNKIRIIAAAVAALCVFTGQARAQSEMSREAPFSVAEGNVFDVCSVAGQAQGVYEPLLLVRAAPQGHCGTNGVLVRIIHGNTDCREVVIFSRAAEPSPDADWDGILVCGAPEIPGRLIS